MVDFNEARGKLEELTPEEIDAHREAALEEFNSLKDAELSEDTANRMTEIADFVADLSEELKAREARQAELANEASDAAKRIAELTAAPTEDEEDDAAEGDVEVPVEDEEEDKDKTEFATAEVEVEVKKEDESEEESDEDKAEDEEEDKEEDSEFASKDAPKAEDEDPKAEDEEEKNDEEFSLEDSATNTEDNNVATTPDELSVQETPESKPAGMQTTIVAGADIPGVGLGAQLDNLKDVASAFTKRLHAIGRNGSGNGEQHTVATFSTAFPEDRVLSGQNRELNESRMDAIASPEAVVAAGGICAPLPVDEEVITYGSTNRPVRDSLPRFNAERGGVIYLTPPSIADIQGAVTVWTLADDYAAIGATLPAEMTGIEKGTNGTSLYPGAVNGTGADVTGPAKPCIRITCGEEIRAYVDAIPQCFTIGNMQARAWPELVEKHLELAMVWQARFAETRLLTRMGNLSTKVHTTARYGLTRDFLDALSLAVAAFRSRHRLDDAFKLRAILPIWFREAIRADMRKQIPGDGQDATFDLSDATIDRWIAASGVNVTWTLDGEQGQVFGEQDGDPVLSGAAVTPGTEAALNGFPKEVVWYLFPEGGFVFLDGGTLDLGIVRDSTLNSKNDYQIFVETFEGLIKRAPETFRIRTDLKVLGATTGTFDPAV